MEKKTFTCISLIVLAMFAVSFTAAQEYSIDISGLKTGDYNSGEDITFKIILLQGEKLVTEEVQVRIYDAFEKNQQEIVTLSNKDNVVKVRNDFISGIWTMEATFKDSSVARTFNIGQNSQVEFELEGDTLIIRNVGNSRYTKTIQITIGGETKSYTQNLGIGIEKVLKLISPKGVYEIEVTDGITSIKRENIQLFGTGNVVGAIDEGLVGYTGFAGVGDPEELAERGYSLKKLPLTLTFIASILVITILVVFGKRFTSKQ